MDTVIRARAAGPFELRVGDRLLIPRFLGTAGIGRRKLESPDASVEVLDRIELPGDYEKYGGDQPSYTGYKFNASGCFRVVTGAVGGITSVNIQFGIYGGPLSLCYADVDVSEDRPG